MRLGTASRAALHGLARLLVALLVASPVLAFLARGATTARGPAPVRLGVLSATMGSLLLGAGAAAGAVLLAWPAALVLRRRTRASSLLAAAALVPLVVPAYVLAIGWCPLLGTGSLVARWLDVAPLYTPLGAGLVQAFQLWPIPALLGAAALRRADARCEEGARLMAGRSIAWRHAAPGLGAGFAVALVLSAGDFGVSGSFNLATVPEEIYVRYSSLFDPRAAAAAALPLVVLLPTVLLLTGRLAGRLLEATPRPCGEPSTFAWCASAVVLFLAIGVPAAHLVSSGAPVLGQVLTLHRSEIVASLLYASLAALLGGVAAVIATGYRMRAWIEAAFVLPFALPGVVTAIGVRTIESASERWLDRGAGTEVLLVLALAARVAWLPWKALDLAIGAKPDSASEAARVHGASPLRGWWWVEVPRALPALTAGLAAALILALGDVSAVAILFPPSGPTLSWRIFDLIHYGYQSNVAALCLLLGGGVLTIGGVLSLLAFARRRA